MNISKNTRVINPYTNEFSFGIFPEIDSRGIIFPEGHIYLRYGEHRRANRGFGVEHIWAEHNLELHKHGYTDMQQVSKYVADIITPGARIYSEFYPFNSRVQVLKNALGLAILEQREDGEGNIIYSVITAYTGNVKGTQIGALPRLRG